MENSENPEFPESANAPPRVRVRTRTIALATAFGAVAVTLAIVLAPFAGAASPGATTWQAPYTGESLESAYWASEGCGHGVAVKTLPNLNLSTGAFTGSVSDNAWSCGSADSSEFAEIQGSYASNAWTTTNGSHVVTVTWTVSDKVGLSAKGSDGASYAIVGFYAVVDDQTNNTSFVVGENTTYYGSTTHTTWSDYSYTVTLSNTLDLVAGHSYTIVTGIYVEVNSFVGAHHDKASAAVYVTNDGRQGDLSSIVIS
jgi:hypothetical protein